MGDAWLSHFVKPVLIAQIKIILLLLLSEKMIYRWQTFYTREGIDDGATICIFCSIYLTMRLV